MTSRTRSTRIMDYQSANPQHWYLPNSARGTCAELDVHPRTHTGYFKV